MWCSAREKKKPLPTPWKLSSTIALFQDSFSKFEPNLFQLTPQPSWHAKTVSETNGPLLDGSLPPAGH